MAGRQCFHCKQWIEESEPHDCWTTTESALTSDLSEDLQDAYQRLRETAVSFGDQRIYASHKSIMYARKACYFFVRPKRSALEIVFFLGRTVKAPQIRKVVRSSQLKLAHVVHVTHRDEVEAPITAWLQEAYETSDVLTAKARTATRGAKNAKVNTRNTRKAGQRAASLRRPAKRKAAKHRSR